MTWLELLGVIEAMSLEEKTQQIQIKSPHDYDSEFDILLLNGITYTIDPAFPADGEIPMLEIMI